MNILLIEPDDFMRCLFQAVLERDGFSVTAVKNNREGLAASGATPFDLVVAQFIEEADVVRSANLLASLKAHSPWFKLLAVLSGFRTNTAVSASIKQTLHPWRTVDLTRGGHVLLDACMDAAREWPSGTPPLMYRERSRENSCV